MELILQQGLPHQQKAVDVVCNAFKGIHPLLLPCFTKIQLFISKIRI